MDPYKAQIFIEIGFLREMVPFMLDDDRDLFGAICKRADGGPLPEEDRKALGKLFRKFEPLREGGD